MKIAVFCLCILAGMAAPAQKINGSWFGVADAYARGTNDNYLTELTLRQKGNDVEGVFGYYFRDGYQSIFIRGTYNPSTRVLTIKNIPVVHYKSRNIDGVDCMMDFNAVLMVSQVKSTLKGSFSSHDKYKYTCPELLVNFELDNNATNPDSVIANTMAGIKKYWKPRQEELVINTSQVNNAAPVVVNAVTAVPNADSLQKQQAIAQLVAAFEQRKNILSDEIEIESDSVRISFYDNGDVDGDSVSVFINKLPVLTQQPLTARSLNMYLAIDAQKPVTEISMYAENLGKYPPNTALMVVTDGDKRHEIYLSSSLTQNAVVRLKKKKTGTKIQ